MILYFKTGSCSMAPHIILKEVGVKFEKDQVDTNANITDTGKDYASINTKGYVPALALNDGTVLTEVSAILQYIADQHPEKNLAPAPSTLERTRMQEYLSFVGAELHKSFSPLFRDNSTVSEKTAAKEKVAKHFDYLDTLLSDDRQYLLGDNFSVTDAYLFTVTNWANFVDIDLKQWPNLTTYFTRVLKREATQSAMQAEGLNT